MCSLEDCERKSLSLGYCSMHYRRFRRTGNPKVKNANMKKTICINGHIDMFRDFKNRRRCISCRGLSVRLQTLPSDFKQSTISDRYFVNSTGKVYIQDRHGYKPCKLTCSKNPGYLRFTVRISKINRIISVHQEVAKLFIENPRNYPVVNHKDGNKLNNNVTNLEWCTQAYNVQHAWNIGLRKKGKSGVRI